MENLCCSYGKLDEMAFDSILTANRVVGVRCRNDPDMGRKNKFSIIRGNVGRNATLT